MAFNRPTLAEILARVKGDIETRMEGASALRRTVLGVIAKVIAGAAHILHGHLDYLSRQLMPDTAELSYLERWCAIWKVPRKAASSATGQVSFTGTDNSVIPAETLLQRADGVEYTTDAEVTISGGTATADVTATTDNAGADGNCDAGTSLTIVSPLAGVSSTGTVAAGGLTGGADQESDDALRERLLDRIQQPPQGGSKADYKAWALEVAGVTRAWVFPQWLGDGTVGISFVCDDASPIIPDAAMVTTVQDYIDEVRPVAAAGAEVFAPTGVALNFTIALTPDTTTVRTAVETELTDLLQREAEVDDGAGSGTILLTHIAEAISIAAGETDHSLVSPAADVTLTAGQISTMGTITWQ
ncbi:MAG: baseplate J/gp47 family protein [Desulfobulbaceae bacterium]|nr:baseplate J/gp47 family protein [Desulfobulbaceae bacterium]